MVNWQEAVACKRCGAPLGAQAPQATYTAGQWASPYAPPPPTGFYPMAAFPGATAVEAGVWRRQSTLVSALDAGRETTLPNLCVKCGRDVPASDFKKKLYWHPPAYYLLLLVNMLVFAIVAMIVRKNATVHMGVCEEHRAKRRSRLRFGSFLIVLCLLLLVFGVGNETPALIFIGIFGTFGAIIFTAVSAQFVTVKKIDERFVWLNGVDKGYLARLPEWNGM